MDRIRRVVDAIAAVAILIFSAASFLFVGTFFAAIVWRFGSWIVGWAITMAMSL